MTASHRRAGRTGWRGIPDDDPMLNGCSLVLNARTATPLLRHSQWRLSGDQYGMLSRGNGSAAGLRELEVGSVDRALEVASHPANGRVCHDWPVAGAGHGQLASISLGQAARRRRFGKVAAVAARKAGARADPYHLGQGEDMRGDTAHTSQRWTALPRSPAFPMPRRAPRRAVVASP